MIAGKRFATGTVYPSNNIATVSGLSFLPRIILMWYHEDTNPTFISGYFTLYSADNGTDVNGKYRFCIPTASGVSTYVLDGTTYYVNNGGFRSPVKKSAKQAFTTVLSNYTVTRPLKE